MSRHLLLFGLAAVPAIALTACEAQSTLSKAKPGECYSVVGRGSMGEAKIAKVPCAGSPAALAAACPTPATPATPAPATPGAACPTPAAATGTKGAVTAHKASSRATSTGKAQRRVVRASQGSRARTTSRTSHASRDYAVARSGEVTSLGLDYARADQELAGGPGHYAGGYQHHDSYAGGEQYARREQYGRVEHGPPPPPPPVHYGHRGATLQYSERSRQSSAYSESYSSSSRGGYGRVECDCEGGVRGQPPHSPFDDYGYLTWRGKTPG